MTGKDMEKTCFMGLVISTQKSDKVAQVKGADFWGAFAHRSDQFEVEP